MKKVYAMMAAALLVASMATSCAEKDDVATDGDSQYVDFSVGGGDTRTVRDKNDKYQINWKEGDKVRVFSDKATTSDNKNNADYDVVNIGENDEKQMFRGKLQGHEGGLQWTEEYQQHKFFAVYPADDSKVVSADMDKGTITFKAQTNQRVEVTDSAEISVEGVTGKRQKFTCAPVMENAYMVATAEANNGSKVALNFDPINTTLDVTIKNVTNNNTANDGIVSVMGVRVIDKHAAASDEFVYNVNTKSLAGTATATDKANDTQTTYVSFQKKVKDANGNDKEQHFLDLKNGEEVSFTVFLPPVPINADRQLTLQVSCSNGPHEVTIGGNKVNEKTLEFQPRNLGNIKLNVNNAVENNNWITPLDEKTYVQQLSIPGTNGAMTYLVKGDAQTQTKTFNDQLALGIRAFDIHTDHDTGSSFYLSVDGKIKQQMDGNDATLVNLFKHNVIPFLRKNPGEFIILFITEDDAWSTIWSTDAFADRLKSSLTNVVESDGTKKDYIVAWRKDLTIKDCRGKVVVMTRYGGSHTAMGDYPSRMEDDFKVSNSSTPSEKTIFVGDKNKPTDKTTLYYFAKNSGKNYTNVASTRRDYMVAVLNKAKENASNFPWSMCYMAGSANRDDDTEGYMKNAAAMHPLFFDWINEQTTYGPLGIIFMDYVGNRKETYTSGNTTYTTYGDLLPQAIIDNNYRFTMKRKTN